MRTIEINLATRPFHNNLLLYLGYAAGIVTITAFTAFNVLTLTRHARTVAQLDSEMASGRAQLEQLNRDGERYKKEIESRNLKDLAQRINAANGILVEREFSWTRLLSALEEAEPYKVRLLDLRPTVSPAGVLIQARGIARDLDNYLELQQKLLDHPMFRRVYPTGYNRQAEGGEFMFAISFNYFPNPQDAPPEGQEAAVTPETVAAEARRHAASAGAVEGPGGMEAPVGAEAPVESGAPPGGDEAGGRQQGSAPGEELPPAGKPTRPPRRGVAKGK